MKIGIVTYYRVANYGAMLQAYSLQKYLERMGHEVVFVKHARCSSERISLCRIFVSRNLAGLRAKIKNYVCHPITDFAKDYPQTEWCETIDEVKIATKDCDAFIVGSDQMWNPLWCSGVMLPLVMLDFVADGTIRLSYAASFGTKEWREDQNAVEAGRMLKKFKAISVRENSGVELVEKLSGRKDAKCVLDPTLLQTSAFYRKIIDKNVPCRKNGKKPYVFRYILDEWTDPNELDIALGVVKERLNIPNVETDRKKVTGSVGLICRALGVKAKIALPEWLEKIASSEFVFTNSFHGTAFAILFHKPFVSVLIKGKMSGMNERALSLLKLVGLESRAVYSDELGKFAALVGSSIKWDEVDSRLDQQRVLAQEFLKCALMK
jgi:hypothetical protein